LAGFIIPPQVSPMGGAVFIFPPELVFPDELAEFLKRKYPPTAITAIKIITIIIFLFVLSSDIY
jgi:hypothetical protein